MGRTDKKKQARKKREAENKVPTIAEQLLELEARGIPNIVEAIEDADCMAILLLHCYTLWESR